MLTGEENRGARKVRKMMTGTEQAAGMVRKMMASAVQAASAARKTGMIALFAAVLSAAGCTYPYERTYPVLTEEEELSALPCQRADSGGFSVRGCGRTKKQPKFVPCANSRRSG